MRTLIYVQPILMNNALRPNRSLNRTLHSVPAFVQAKTLAQILSRCSGPVSFDVRRNTKTSSRYLVGDHLLSKSNKCTTVVTGRPSAGGRRTALPFDQLRTSTVSSAPAGTGPRGRWYPEIAHRNLGSGRPSAGGRRTVSSLSACTPTAVGFRIPPPCTGISKLAAQVFRRQFSN